MFILFTFTTFIFAVQLDRIFIMLYTIYQRMNLKKNVKRNVEMTSCISIHSIFEPKKMKGNIK